MELTDINLKELIERETGQKFNRENKILSPFSNEKTPSFAIYFDSNNNKYKFKDFSTGKGGDALDFIMELRGFDYNQAREHLGLSKEKTSAELLQEKVEGYINWQISNTDFRKGQKLLGIFQFTDNKNNTLYFKAKFLKPDGSKELSYYHIENDKVINKRGSEEVIYNLYNVLKGIDEGKIIILTEGEKDANKLNSLLKNNGYVAASVKGCKDLFALEGAKIYVCGDTGEAGEKYKHYIYTKLFNEAKVYKIINLQGIENMPNNSDVTDWLNAGHTKQDLFNAFKGSLDLKNKHELQQDSLGVYKIVFKNDEEKRVQLTNFRVVEAITINYIDRDIQGIKLICKSDTGKIFERVKEVNVFDDVRSFKNFLGVMELSYKGDLKDLVVLKEWINRYFIHRKIYLYDNPKFIQIDNKLCLITNDGVLLCNGIDISRRSEGNLKINVINNEPITREELNALIKYLFKFSTLPRSYSIIGTVINDLAIDQAMKLKISFHHLLIAGESGSGKTTITNKVIVPILNYPVGEIKSIGMTTPFALTKELDNGNYPLLLDEYKPSRLDKNKNAKLSETFRNAYDRAVVTRGDKTLSVNYYHLIRPLIISGEEGYYNQEKALIDRSCIVYLSKNERNKENTEAMQYLEANEVLLNKLGRSLVDMILNLSLDEYASLREKAAAKIKELKDRPLNTAINICTGIEILNKVLMNLKLPIIEDYIDEVINNVKVEILEGGEEPHSTVEKMLILYNQMIEDNRACGSENTVKFRADGIFIRTSEMLTQIRVHVITTGLNADILDDKDFVTQAKKAGYLIGKSNKKIKLVDQDKTSKSKWFDTYSSEKLRALHLDAIIPPILTDVTEYDKIIPFA